MTTNMSTQHHHHNNENKAAPNATPVNIIHTNKHSDADSSTITGTGDGTTPSS